MASFYKVNNLCYSYLKKPLCIKDASFVAGKNSKILLLGSKGSGKTTLVKILSGFDEKYFGSIKKNDIELKTIDDKNKNCSIVFETPVLLNSTVEKNLKFLFKVLNLDIPSYNDLKEMFLKFGLNLDLKTKVKNMTLFEKYKFCLLRAFVKKSEMLFIDDIFKNLDEFQAKEINSIVNKYFSDLFVFIACGENSLKKNKAFIDEISINKILYLHNAKVEEYKSFDEFRCCLADENVLKFCDCYNKKDAHCLRKNDEYFLDIDKNFVKLDKRLYESFDKLKLENDEQDDVLVVCKTDINIDFTNNSEINKAFLRGDLFIFHKLDGERIL